MASIMGGPLKAIGSRLVLLAMACLILHVAVASASDLIDLAFDGRQAVVSQSDCGDYAERYLMQYVDEAGNRFDLNRVIQDYADLAPCGVSGEFSECCKTLDAMWGPTTETFMCTCFEEVLDAVTFKHILPQRLVNSFVKNLELCGLPLPNSCTVRSERVEAEVTEVKLRLNGGGSGGEWPLLEPVQVALNKSKDMMSALRNSSVIKIGGLPLFDELESILESIRIRGIPIRDFMSRGHLVSLYRSLTVADFPLHRIFDLVIFQFTDMPDVSLEEAFDYMVGFIVGAVEARVGESRFKQDLLRVLETVELDISKNATHMVFDLPLVLEFAMKDALRRGWLQKSNYTGPDRICSCLFKILNGSVALPESLPDDADAALSAHVMSVPVAGHIASLGILPAGFTRTWRAMTNYLQARRKAKGSVQHQKTQEILIDIMQALIADLLHGVSLKQPPALRGLFSLDPWKDVCLELQGLDMCVQSLSSLLL